MKLFKNYKKLYNQEKENNEMLNKKLSKIKEDRARLFVELEDTRFELSVKEEVIGELKKDNTNLKRIKTRYENKLKANKEV